MFQLFDTKKMKFLTETNADSTEPVMYATCDIDIWSFATEKEANEQLDFLLNLTSTSKSVRVVWMEWI